MPEAILPIFEAAGGNVGIFVILILAFLVGILLRHVLSTQKEEARLDREMIRTCFKEQNAAILMVAENVKQLACDTKKGFDDQEEARKENMEFLRMHHDQAKDIKRSTDNIPGLVKML